MFNMLKCNTIRGFVHVERMGENEMKRKMYQSRVDNVGGRTGVRGGMEGYRMYL